ncbi:MAG: hypothetical protein CMJ76_04180 [Planctomycetaceae bacterium]|nr:hypothetical protein [Planctomycetaceae bacterium]
MVRRILNFQAAQAKVTGQAEIMEPLQQKTHVKVKLGQILPALTDALLSQRAWVEDFEDDQIEVSKDLYEVIQAYERMRNAA